MDVEISLEEVFQAYFECRRNKRRTFNALSFEVNYEIECVKLWREINSQTYNIGRSICFIVTRPKQREIFAATFRDRVVHHIIMHRLEPLFEAEFIQDNYNCRKNKGTLYGVKRLHEQVRQCSENYTKDCYIAKFDFQGFFMSIHKPTLYKKLHEFITTYYKGEDINLLLYLVKKVVLHNPELNCIKRSPARMWDGLPENKSLFTTGKDYGMPIGNLTSQMFANFYINQFDKLMLNKFHYYGRYVDDFFVIVRNKQEILQFISTIRKYLWNELNVTLHPDKLYVQNYQKGCLFTGAVVKRDLIYTSNRTVSNFIEAVHKYNMLSRRITNFNITAVDKFLSSVNSYFGFLIHYNTYSIRRKMFKMFDSCWKQVCTVYGDFNRLCCKREYDRIQQIKDKIKQFDYFKIW